MLSGSDAPASPVPTHPPAPPRTRVPFSAHRIRQAALHVNRVLPGWLEGLLEYLLAGFQRRMRSPSRVPDGAVNPPSLCCQPILCSGLFSPSCVALFTLLYFTAFLPIRHVEKTCRQNRSEPGTGYLNPVMGSMG